MKKIIGIFIAITFFRFINLANSEDQLEVFKEEELLQLFHDEKFVIVLLSKSENCVDKCKVLERTLLSIREDLVEDTGGWVVRSHAPNYFEEMGLQDSTILFMRDRRPLVYNDKSNGENEENLLTYLLSNKISVVHNLTDSDFEHKTQAGTGATTGDWLIIFMKRECETCTQLLAMMEQVSVNLKGRLNVGLIDREVGAVTARRFGVKSFPSFALFRLGKLYRYAFDKYDASTLTAFAKDTFRNVKSELVPAPKSPFDDVTEAVADWLRENPEKCLISIGGLLLAVGIIFLLNKPPPESWTKGKSKKKKA